MLLFRHSYIKLCHKCRHLLWITLNLSHEFSDTPGFARGRHCKTVFQGCPFLCHQRIFKPPEIPSGTDITSQPHGIFRIMKKATLIMLLCLPPFVMITIPSAEEGQDKPTTAPWIVVLGIAQDGGVPQAGSKNHPAWDDVTKRRLATCLALVDPQSPTATPGYAGSRQRRVDPS